ncbi:ATPase family AAA domain-containing protein 2 [Eumeta japonica]|uniref:ATPase family AAA domain-containing protein 2 n=1 Tax=Eumeta variegata TaxID=151549 RepID=A0A4C1UUH0_EUMVA|nr:ATPase family AAA domain-containing protein 2 [Eumeta japonica]
MVKTRRSNGENGEIDEGNYVQNDVGSVSDEKGSNSSQRELRSGQYRVTRKIQHWPAKLSRRLRKIKMPRIVFPESDTEPEKYARRRQVRVFFAGDTKSANRSVRIRRSRGPRKNYMEDSEDKPIQQNVRRSCRKRKLLHHNFNESWITNELKVRGYPGLYGLPGSSSSDEFTSGDEAQTRDSSKKLTRASHVPTNTDEDTQLGQQRRTSARFKKITDATESESEEDNNQTVIEKKIKNENETQNEKMDIQNGEKESKSDNEQLPHDSESNHGPVRPTRTKKSRSTKKDDSQQESPSDTDSSDSGSDIVLNRQPRRSNRTRKPKQAFVEITPRQTPQSPSSTSSSSSTDTEEDLNVSVKNKSKGRQKSKAVGEKTTERALREIQPIEVDGSVRFSSVGGLEDHIKCLREMVLFPLMYPDLFQKFKTRPAKGVLFHGPPGTGKTLLARALANECSLVGGRKVAFFMRKGADCLKKWVGESERHLKLLFQQANTMKPSIIFFDEIDALAPVRSVRQEQVHTSVVGTLLAEMDGLCDRGEVVVIGATNRLDAVDPALRRAGRFDRELHFPPPPATARRDILNIYTKEWDPKPPDEVLDHIAQITNGYGGSDLKALCSEAVLKALRRVYPQVYESEHALVINAQKVEVIKADMLEAMHSLVAAGARTTPIPAKALPQHVEPLLKTQVDAAQQILKKIYVPPQLRRLDNDVLSSSTFLLTGPCAESHIAPALLATLEHCAVKELSVATLHTVHAFTSEQALISLWRARACGDTTLLLATSASNHASLPEELQNMFPLYKQCMYCVREPTTTEIVNFLKPIIIETPMELPIIENKEPPPPLPLGNSPPPPPRESPAEISRRKRKEDYKLRELRIFLRDICRKLASNRRFYKFTKPVDLEEVTDYLDIIKQPMDLETMMTKVDMHKYNCAKEFLDDIDLICANALEYNPDRTSSDKQIRHEACSLRDHAHALIEVEMDSDFEIECQDIAKRRREEGTRDDADLPDFIYTASNLPEGFVTSGGVSANTSKNRTPQNAHNGDKNDASQGRRKRRRINAWSKGLVVKRQKTSHKTYKEQNSMVVTDEESKENKPITSTPLPNGDVAHGDQEGESTSSGSASDDDTPLRHRARNDSEVLNLSEQVKSETLDRSVPGDEKWITYEKNVQKKSWLEGKQIPQTIAKP